MGTYLIAGLAVFGLFIAVRFMWKLLLAGQDPEHPPTPSPGHRGGKRRPKTGSATQGSKKKRPKAQLGIDELARRMGVSLEELKAFSPSYHNVQIPKRNGGTRKLDVPDSRTKELQRRVLQRILQRLNSHPAAFGFERQRSIVDHAELHTGQAAVVRMDIVDFFPTTRSNAVRALYRRLGWDSEAVDFLVKLTTHRDGLPQGASTSPRLSNLVNHILDRRLTGLAKKFNATYSRYADDITFSFSPKQTVPPNQSHRYPRRLNLNTRIESVILITETVLESMGYKLHRDRKLSVAKSSAQQRVTGLVVNEKVALPRSRRRWLRAVKHRFEQNREATISRNQLQGWLAFEQMVNRNRGESVTAQMRSLSSSDSSSPKPRQTPPIPAEPGQANQEARAIQELIGSIESTRRMSPERREAIEAAIGKPFMMEMKVDREYQGIGLDAPDHLQGGVAVLLRSDSPRAIVDVHFRPDDEEFAKSLRRGQILTGTLSFLKWDETFDRAICEFVE